MKIPQEPDPCTSTSITVPCLTHTHGRVFLCSLRLINAGAPVILSMNHVVSEFSVLRH